MVIFQQKPLKSVGLLVKDFNSMVENHTTPGGKRQGTKTLRNNFEFQYVLSKHEAKFWPWANAKVIVNLRKEKNNLRDQLDAVTEELASLRGQLTEKNQEIEAMVRTA